MSHKKTKRHLPYYYSLTKLKDTNLNYFVAGFVDGEGSFSVSLTKQKNRYSPKGWKWIINPVFQVYQHGRNIDVLLVLKDHVFKTGRIHKKTSPYNVFIYSIENHRTLKEKVVPFFRKYMLATKAEDFEKFADIIQRMNNGEHKTITGFKRIVRLAFDMNASGKRRKYSQKDIFETLPDQFTRGESSETIRRNP